MVSSSPPPPSASPGGPERYDLLELLGEGGMGRVYKAYDHLLKREVALKFIRSEDALEAQRLLLEARIQAGLDHPGIAKVYEVGDWEGRPFIAMQLVRGVPLDALAPHLGLRAKAELMADIAEAVHQAHRQGLVHRDLKPGNLLAVPEGEGRWHPFVVDFGLARGADQPDRSRAGLPEGTLAYMAPEQASGAGLIDARSDVYSLGASLYALIAGAPPFAPAATAAAPSTSSGALPEGAFSLYRAVLEEEPPPLRARVKGVPRDLETIALTCLQKDPRDRYASALALAEDLRRFLAGRPIQARRTGLLSRAGKWVRRHPGIAALGLATAIALGALQIHAAGRVWRASVSAIRFGAEAQELESQLRTAFLLPRHDLRPDLARARARLKTLEEQVRAGGAGVQGPGAFALGRAHLALRDFEAAQRELERARGFGFQGPDLALALGLTYGELYRLRCDEVERIADADTRRRAQAEADRTLRDQALAQLKEAAQGGGERAAYAEGLLAYYRDDLEEAIAKARAAAARDPGLYEAHRLEGDVHLRLARRHFMRGDFRGAMPAFDASRQAYERALQLARSDASLYLAEGHRSYLLAFARLDRGLEAEEATQAGLRAVAAAQEVDPDNPWSAFLGANLSLCAGEIAKRKGDSTAPALEKARAFAEQGIALAPDKSYAWVVLAAICGGEIEERPPGDPAIPAVMERGLAAVEWALKLDARSFNAHYIRSTLLRLAAELREGNGEDPLPLLEEGVHHSRQSLALGGNRPQSLLSEGLLHAARARHLVERGREGSEAAADAAARFEEAHGAGSGQPNVAVAQAEWLLYWGAVQQDLGGDGARERGALLDLARRFKGGPSPLPQRLRISAELLRLRTAPLNSPGLPKAAEELAAPGLKPGSPLSDLAVHALALQIRALARQGRPWRPVLETALRLHAPLPPDQRRAAGLELLRAWGAALAASRAAEREERLRLAAFAAGLRPVAPSFPELRLIEAWAKGSPPPAPAAALLQRRYGGLL